MTTPLNATINQNGDRVYTVGTDGDRQYISVTSVLNALPKQQWLIPWASRLAAERALDFQQQPYHEWRGILEPYGLLDGKTEDESIVNYIKSASREYTKDAGGLGDEVHTLVEHALKLPKEDIMSQLQSLAVQLGLTFDDQGKCEALRRVEHFAAWYTTSPYRVIAQEFTVFNDTVGYAGSCDLALEHEKTGEWFYTDVKSGALREDASMQLIAYVKGEYVYDAENNERKQMPRGSGKFGGAMVIQTMKTKCKIAIVNEENYEELWKTFRYLLEMKYGFLAMKQKDVFTIL